MGALTANLSIGRMIRVLALLCLAILSMGEPEAEAKAVADPKADPYLLYRGYYGLGHHYGGYYGYPYYYGKRSADAEPVAAPEADAKAEADPWYGYYGLGHLYGGYYGYPYSYYGKRFADAEPAPASTADAKADPWYGYYGGLGYYGYGYPYYGYGYYLGK